ncbi:MAG TPA: DUF5908 family protein [Candidatus Angelobacter sp.]|nr:DUF5908 family protein [Candidatus Angelobacter sp.]
MPIEIRELVIKAVVVEGPSESQKTQRALAGMKQEILKECRETLRDLVLRISDR